MTGANYYRIGWVAYADYQAVTAAGLPWMEAFAFVDIANRGQTAHTIARLAPGLRYAFIVASNDTRYGEPQWSEWVVLTLNESGAACPTAAPTPTPAPTRTPRPTPTPTRAPVTSGDYDADNDGLIEVSNLAQLNAIRWDLDGDGSATAPGYATAFPNARAGMGCAGTCRGYELTANLNFDTNRNGRNDAGDAYWNYGEGWVPIGDRNDRFDAIFDGRGHSIANLSVTWGSNDYTGLFGATGYNSVITRVGLVTVSVHGGDLVGALVGSNYGRIADSYATGDVTGNTSVGGLVGYNYDGTITASYSTGNVTGDDNYVGGLVGNMRSGGAITASYSTGNVTGHNYVGGLVGSTEGGAITITASYATGNIIGTSSHYYGGLVGYNGGMIIASYSIGEVKITGSNAGGLVGTNGGRITRSYWDTLTSGQSDSDGGIGKTTRELQSPTGYTGIYVGWNVDVDGDGSDDDPWHFGSARQYPVLKYGGLSVAAQRR